MKLTSAWPQARSISRTFGLALLGLAAISLLTTESVAQPDPPYEAEVVVDTAVVRSGGGRGYYEVGQLSRGERVTVVDQVFLWHVIKCPPDVTCFIERKNVDAKGDGKRGVVNTDETNVYVSHISKGPADSYRPRGVLQAGDVVEIIETVDNAYRIVAPKHIYVCMRPDTLAPVTGEAAKPQETEAETQESTAEAETEAAAETQAVEPAKPEVVEPVVVNPPVIVKPEPAVEAPAEVAVEEPAPAQPEVDAEAAVVDIDFEEPAAPVATKVDLLNDPTADVPLPDTPTKTNAENELLRAVEVAMLPYFTLPVDQQPIAKMVKGYADAAQVRNLSDQDMAIISARLTELERNRELALAMAELDATSQEVNDGQAAPEEATADSQAPADVEPIEEPVVEKPAPRPAAPVVTSGYDAVGILASSSVHTGGNQPELFRLLDPTGRRTIAYLEPSESIDTVQMIGRLIGIVGTKTFDHTTKLNLIQPSKIDILGTQ